MIRVTFPKRKKKELSDSHNTMKIELKSGITVDTHKMTDRDAEIHEALNNLFQVCKKHNVASFLRVVLSKNNHVGMHTMPDDPNRVQDEYSHLIHSLAEWVAKTSDNQLQLVEVNPSE